MQRQSTVSVASTVILYARSAANVMFIILTATGIGSDQRSYVTWNEKAEAQVIWKQLV